MSFYLKLCVKKAKITAAMVVLQKSRNIVSESPQQPIRVRILVEPIQTSVNFSYSMMNFSISNSFSPFTITGA